MVMNVYKQTYKNWPDNEYWSLGECAAKTATLLGISAVTVGRNVKEQKKTETLSSPKKGVPKTNFVQKMDDFTMSAIRRIVHHFFRRNEAPPLKKVLQVVNEDSDLPNMSQNTMGKLLKHLKFRLCEP